MIRQTILTEPYNHYAPCAPQEDPIGARRGPVLRRVILDAASEFSCCRIARSFLGPSMSMEIST